MGDGALSLSLKDVVNVLAVCTSPSNAVDFEDTGTIIGPPAVVDSVGINTVVGDGALSMLLLLTKDVVNVLIDVCVVWVGNGNGVMIETGVL